MYELLKANFISPGEAARLAGGLSFASSVALAKFGRPFLQPLYAAASGKLIAPMKDTTLPGDWVMTSATAATLPERLRLALEWWELLLLHLKILLGL